MLDNQLVRGDREVAGGVEKCVRFRVSRPLSNLSILDTLAAHEPSKVHIISSTFVTISTVLGIT